MNKLRAGDGGGRKKTNERTKGTCCMVCGHFHTREREVGKSWRDQQGGDGEKVECRAGTAGLKRVVGGGAE